MLKINTIRKTFNPDTPNEVRALQGVNLTLDEGSLVLDGTDITKWPEHKRAKFIGRVFQNPFSGTAPRMTIAENLALAARRGQPRGLGWALKSNVRQQLRERVSHLRLGLEDRLDNSIAQQPEEKSEVAPRNGRASALRLFAQPVARATDGEALVVQQIADAADQQHFVVLVVAPVASALHRLELGELLFPIAQHVRLDAAQLAHLTDGEVALCGNGWERFLH